MRIIPAIDIIDGQCVRLTKGDYDTKKMYHTNPVEVAKQFEDYGISYLHVVDLDGAKSKHIVNYKVLEKICNQTYLKVDFGGGLKSDEDVKIAFESGANQVTGGSIAATNATLFESWIEKYGSEKIILGADFLNRKIAINGWQEKIEKDIISFLKSYQKKQIQYAICTDISKDGNMKGPSFNIYKEILQNTAIKLIASGGITTMNDLKQLKEMGCEGAIIGKAIYEKNISLKQLSTLC
ncbi:MAG: 1-(5-phosphoribosyl)-5-[(5-phosphoribosylamino)methylideneamino]imidazole-4-carboxamide isomerase [Lutibacter sp.]